MKRSSLFFSLAAVLLSGVLFSGCNHTKPIPPQVKYVFYFIGDGMGYQQILVTQAYLVAINETHGNIPLSFTEFPYTGVTTTYAYNRYITGSAAAGTALATGSKTSINTLGLNHDHADTLYSIAYLANKAGFNVGIATSVSIDHATPAAFYAHQTNRNYFHRIAHDLLVSEYRFFGSGGFRDPYGTNCETPKGDIFEKGVGMGYLFTSDLSNSDSILNSFNSIVYSAPNPVSSSSLKYQIDAKDDDITLAQVTKLGIEILTNPNGFFFMVEGGKIDWACHDNDAATTIHDMIAFSDAVAVALDFYNMHPEETLIIVTSDHETGGMSMGNRISGYDSNISILSAQKQSLEMFSNTVIEFKKKHQNNPSFQQVLKFLATNEGLTLSQEQLQKHHIEQLKLAHLASVKSSNSDQCKKNKKDYGSFDPIAVTSVRILNELAGIGWTSFSHTGSYVPVYAIGTGSNLFSGQMDNTDVPKRIALAMGLTLE